MCVASGVRRDSEGGLLGRRGFETTPQLPGLTPTPTGTRMSGQSGPDVFSSLGNLGMPKLRVAVEGLGCGVEAGL
jgi:hypothetical protein